MLSTTIFTLFAAVPASGAGSLSPACTILLNSPPVISARQGRTPQEIRESYRQAVLHSSSHHNPDPLKVTPELLLLYWEIANPKSMPAYERRKMQRGLKVRLEIQWKKLGTIHRQERISARRSPRILATRGKSVQPVASARGGGVASQAAALIELIRNTIEPDSWDVNGGLGRISFLGDPYYVLVIRATGDVHRQIGGVLGK